MILFHGTSSRWLDQILAQGIRPRRRTRFEGNWTDTVNSHANHVYLTDSYAPYFAECAIPSEDHKSVPVVFVVDTLRIPQLVADEDAIEQVERRSHPNEIFSKSDVYERTRRFATMAPRLAASGKFTHHDSLTALGTCAAVDTIPRQAIIGYIRLKRVYSWQVWDPTITLENYRFMGDFYRHVSEYLWLGKSDKPLAGYHQFRHSPERLYKSIDEMIIERANIWKEMLGLEPDKSHAVYRNRKQLTRASSLTTSSPSLLEQVITAKSTPAPLPRS
jgi:RNA:NAD 2''-phosphotransferase